MEWQPIATAPKDGTRILGWNGEYVSEMIWEDSEDDDGEYGWCDAVFSSGGCLFIENSIFFPKPTHWMPLPEPPKE